MIHKAKKSMGQNFLKSEPALRKIIEAGEIKSTDIILEIGPGKGALTKKLLENAGCVIAVEKDRDLIEFLKEKFQNEIENKKLILLNEDILEIDIKKIFGGLENSFSQVLGSPRSKPKELSQTIQKSIPNTAKNEHKDALQFYYKIIANIPYNITGAILKKFLSQTNQPSMMVLMVQHEVAKRIMARDKKESILSISVKAYGIPKIEMKVPARYFSPAPKVDSAVISIKNISRDFFVKNQINEEVFWESIHAGFAHKRKKLSSNLKKLGQSSKTDLVLTLGNKRAEELSLVDWILFTK